MMVAALFAVHAEIIDRIAMSIGNLVVTTSDIDRDIRVVSFLNGVKPDFRAEARRMAADRLIEQKLVQRELEATRYKPPTPEEVEPAFQRFRKDFYADEQRYRAALAEHGITEADLRSALLWQRALLLFVNERFRPGIQLSPLEIQEYFDKEYAPAARAANPGQAVRLEDHRGQVEEALLDRHVSEELDRWIGEAKRRDPLMVHTEAFQ
jgi:hypothetical protein